MPAPLLLLALHLAGSDPDTTLHLPRRGSVEISSRLRDVSVKIGTTDMVIVRGARAELDGGTLSIDTDDGRRGRPSNGGPIEVTVPAWARMEVSSVAGSLTFVGTPEKLTAETVNGFIKITGGTGEIELNAVAGNVSVTDFRGTRLTIDATGGNVAVTNASGELTIDNVNGGIVLHGMRTTKVTAETINGGIEYEGILAPAGSYDFSSQNDNVTFIVPGDVSARMRITTMNGELRSPQIPATTNGMRDAATGNTGKDKGKNKDKGDGERTFTATFGGGAAHVTVDVFNGDVVVKKKGSA